MNNADMPAMPLTGDAYSDISDSPMTNGRYEQGMGLTKREHFAVELRKAQLIAQPHWESLGYEMHTSPKDAIDEADELLKELDK